MVKMLEQKHKTLQVYQTVGGYVYGPSNEDLMPKIVGLQNVYDLYTCFKYASDNGYGAIIGNIEARLALDTAKQFYKEVELMCVLREPLDRVYSEFCHNLSKGVIHPDYKLHCEHTYNTQYWLTGGNLDIFRHVVDFNSFPEYMESLGYIVEHENKSENKKIYERSDEIAIPYNKLDIELYNTFKQKATQ